MTSRKRTILGTLVVLVAIAAAIPMGCKRPDEPTQPTQPQRPDKPTQPAQPQQPDEPHQSPPWLVLKKDSDGKLSGLTITQKAVPQSVVDVLPHKRTRTKLNDDQIRELMQKYHLFDEREVNSKVRFTDFNVAYWSKQDRPSWEMEVHFLARQLLLEEADRAKVIIETQAKLSRWSSQLYQALVPYVPE
jgi:hypothetical protein